MIKIMLNYGLAKLNLAKNMERILEQEPSNPNLNSGDLPAFLQKILPDGGFDPLEEKIVFMKAQGIDPNNIGWILGLAPNQLAERQATINKRFAEDERVATSLAFKALLYSVHPLQIGGKYVAFRRREKDVFSLMASGYTSSEIGDKLCISPKTADNHRASILDNLGARNRVEAIFMVLAAVPPKERSRFFPPVKKATLGEPLSERETEILTLLVQGKTSQEISEQLFISPKTADNHRASIVGKLGTINLAFTATIALTQELVPTQG